MINVVKTIRSLPSTSFLSPPSKLSRRVTGVSFATMSDQQKMDKKADNPNEKTGDVMSHSFGEGYSTRSDEEGFGGIYGGNQTLQKITRSMKITLIMTKLKVVKRRRRRKQGTRHKLTAEEE